jgi:hypothetical protein
MREVQIMAVALVVDRKDSYPFWSHDWRLAENVPTCAEFGIDPPLEFRNCDVAEWFCMREQLWATREGLA